MADRKKTYTTGFTLVELIIVIALMVVIIGAAFSMLLFSQKVFAKTFDEFEEQADIRLTSQKATETIRYATALFTIPASRFHEGNLDAGWSYIGVQDIVITPADGVNPAVLGSEIVLFRPDGAGHDKEVLMPAEVGKRYQFLLRKKDPGYDNTLLEFIIQGYQEGVVDEYGRPKVVFELVSELEGQNSLQVLEQGSEMDPAVAIGYRTDVRPKSVVAHVAMVMDNSGSMAWGMDGGNSPAEGSSRIAILRREAEKMVLAFSAEENIDISLVPFSTSANNVKPFHNARTETSSLVTHVRNMTALGGTNTGDGLRRAYWQLKNRALTVASGVKVSNYAIILVDGVTTFATAKSTSDTSHYLENDGDVLNQNYAGSGGQILGNGSSLDPLGTAYVNLIGAKLKAPVDGIPYAKVYVIGFSSRTSDLNSVNDIAAASGASSERVFNANSPERLTEIFNAIRQEIVNDIWYLQGPSK